MLMSKTMLVPHQPYPSPLSHNDGMSPSNSPPNPYRLAVSSEELETACQIQRHLVPRALPRAQGWKFAACCYPARALAGDYYDLFEVRPGQVAVALGDVAGKGLGPALVWAGLHALVRNRLPHMAADLPGLMCELNAYFTAFLPSDLFVSLFLGLLDTVTGELRYVNAGHPYPIVLTEHGGDPARLTAGGMMLGVLPDACYEEGQACLGPGSLLAVFSDGVTDARDACGERFQETGILQILRAERESTLCTVLGRLLEAVEHPTGTVPQGDDITLALIRRLPG
jgi:sigma-B regulation protein RsbU (phosphoserine phosphatase)